MPLACVPAPALSSDQIQAQGGGLQSRRRDVTPGQVARQECEHGRRVPTWPHTTVTPEAPQRDAPAFLGILMPEFPGRKFPGGAQERSVFPKAPSRLLMHHSPSRDTSF